jgi:hypothetical protein
MTLSLTGCFENFALGPVSLQRDGTELLIAVCDDIEIGSVVIQTWTSGPGTPTKTVLDATGSLALESRSWLSVSEMADQLSVTTQAAAPMNAGDAIVVQMQAANSRESDFNAAFTIGDEGLPESTLLHPDGRETDGPCF